MKAAILHGVVPEGATKDELDVLVEVNAISKALNELGYDPQPVEFSLDLKNVAEKLQSLRPNFVFNLVESVDGRGRLIHFAPALLSYLKIPYTGCGAEAFFMTNNKVLAKKRLAEGGIPTPDFVSGENYNTCEFEEGRYIVKSAWEHASIGLDEDSIIEASDKAYVFEKIKERGRQTGDDFFAEQFIDGREFNIAVMGSDCGPQVMPAAEMVFDNYPPDKIRVVGYKAKWDENSFEFKHTVRRFDFPERDKELLRNITGIALRCWNLFSLSGYARVDFRVDRDGRPFVLEINVNPCLSPDAGFVAAAERAGLKYIEVIQRIIGQSGIF